MTLAICQVLRECPARPIWPVLDSIQVFVLWSGGRRWCGPVSRSTSD